MLVFFIQKFYCKFRMLSAITSMNARSFNRTGGILYTNPLASSIPSASTYPSLNSRAAIQNPATISTPIITHKYFTFTRPAGIPRCRFVGCNRSNGASRISFSI